VYIVAAIIFALLGVYLWPGNISDTPFSQLTLKLVLSYPLSLACYFGAFYNVMKSMEADRIWPWRWTLPYFGNLCIRAAMCSLSIWAAYHLNEKQKHGDWGFIFLAGGLVMMLMFVCFSSEFDYFKEKNTNAEVFPTDKNG
jgi:hypothetical protein